MDLTGRECGRANYIALRFYKSRSPGVILSCTVIILGVFPPVNGSCLYANLVLVAPLSLTTDP